MTVIGRSAECHLKIASAQVSRRHCLLTLRPDGVYVEDLNSSNGTILDGTRLLPQLPTYVRNGSQLEVGPARFIVEYELDPDAGSGILASGGEPFEKSEDSSDVSEPDLAFDAAAVPGKLELVESELAPGFQGDEFEAGEPVDDGELPTISLEFQASTTAPPTPQPRPSFLKSIFSFFRRSRPDEPRGSPPPSQSPELPNAR